MEGFRNRPDLSLNVGGGVITEVRDHLAVHPALPSKSTGGYKTAEFTEGFPLLYHKKIGGVFNNLLIITGYLENAGGLDNFENFMRDCKNCNLIGGSQNAQPSMNVRAALLEGKAPVVNTSRFEIQAFDTVYVIWLPVNVNGKTGARSALQDLVVEYDAAFGQAFRGDHTFRYPLVIGGKSLTSGSVKQKIYDYVLEKVATTCNPVNALAQNTKFVPNQLFAKAMGVFDPSKDHPLHLRLEDVDSILRSNINDQLTSFQRLCFKYIRAEYGGWVLHGVSPDAQAAALMEGATTVSRTNLNAALGEVNYEPVVNGVTLFSTTKERRDARKSFHIELKKTVGNFIYPMGIALTKIPSDQRGVLHVQSRV